MNAQNPPNPMIAAALDYARRGWKVFPIGAGTKGCDERGRSTHLLPNGHNGASDELEIIWSWWTLWPDANIGLNLAASGLVALDADTYKPGCAWSTFIRDRHLPATLIQRSARGGRHYIFEAGRDASYAGKLCEGVEIKHKGYILLEPSTFEGGCYALESDDPPAPVPDWVPRKPGAAEGSSPRTTDVGSMAYPEGAVPIATTPPGEVEELLSWIDPDAHGYQGWIEVLQAIHDHFAGSGQGLSIAEDWSRRGAKHVDGEVASKWRSFKGGGGITLRSVAARAREYGADLSEIARRHRSPSITPDRSCPQQDGNLPDLSHDDLALDLGRRSWDANAKYVDLWGKWLFWSGVHWQRDDSLEHLTRARAFLRTRANEVAGFAQRRSSELARSGKARDGRQLEKWSRDQSKALRSHGTVIAVSNLARTNPRSAAVHEAFDADPLLVGTPGGAVDLRTGELRAARREEMISRLTTTTPAEPGCVPRVWLRFLDDVTDGDRDIVAFLQRAAGYALTGSTAEHKLLFLHGSGRNGKSVFLNTLLDLWGAYGRRVAATTFLNSQTERHPTDIAGLQGARLAIASELPRGKTWDEAVIKDLTGGDRLTARLMRQDFFDFDPQFTLMIAGNTLPSFRGVDEAIRSRVVLVPFTVTIPQERRDPALPEKLKAEAPAILRWCIEGALSWQERGLDVPKAIAAASEAYFDEEDTIGQFLDDETIRDAQALVAFSDLSARFNQWCDQHGLSAWTQRTLIKELRQRGFKDGRTPIYRGLRGLCLK